MSLYIQVYSTPRGHILHTYFHLTSLWLETRANGINLLASMQLHLKKLQQPSDKRALHWVLELHRSPKDETHTKTPESLIFIKIIIHASYSAKAGNTQGKCLLPALNIKSPNKDRWVVFRNWKQPDPVLRRTQKQDHSKILTNNWILPQTGDSKGTPDSTWEPT